MADGFYDDDEDYDDDVDPRGGTDSDLIRDLRRQLKAAQKAQKEQTQELSRLRAAERERSLGKTLQERGLQPKIAKLIPPDVAENDESLSQWLDDFGDVFGGGSPSQPDPAQAAGEPEAPDAQAGERQRMSALAETGMTPAGGFADFEKRMNAAQSQDEIAQILAEAKQFIT